METLSNEKLNLKYESNKSKYLKESSKFLVKKNLDKIIELIDFANYKYFNTNEPFLTDKEYDNLISFITKYKELENVKNILTKVG